MKKPLVILAILSISLAVSGAAFSQGRSGVQDLSRPKHNAPPMLGIRWARGFNPYYLQRKAQGNGHGHGPGPGSGSSSPDMTYHGGPILTAPTIQSIFWGTTWDTKPGEISGLDTFYTGFNGSDYATTSDEYYEGPKSNPAYVTSTTVYDGSVTDPTQAANGNKTSAILAEVCKVISSPVKNGYYPVYVDLPRKGNYCAYHSWGSCGGIPIEFAFFWNLDNDPGCDLPSSVAGDTSHSSGLAALANVSAHELSEARTDPTGAGWYDSNGEENGDKCAWTFNVNDVTFPGGSTWTLQGEWSNDAYDGGWGYLNSSGQDGCLDGDTSDEYNGPTP